MFAWLKKIRPKWSRSGNTSACWGRLAPPLSTRVGSRGAVVEGDVDLSCNLANKQEQFEEYWNSKRTGGLARTKVDARQVILQGNFLGTKVLLDGDGVVCATLDGGIIGDNHALGASVCVRVAGVEVLRC